MSVDALVRLPTCSKISNCSSCHDPLTDYTRLHGGRGHLAQCRQISNQLGLPARPTTDQGMSTSDLARCLGFSPLFSRWVGRSPGAGFQSKARGEILQAENASLAGGAVGARISSRSIGIAPAHGALVTFGDDNGSATLSPTQRSTAAVADPARSELAAINPQYPVASSQPSTVNGSHYQEAVHSASSRSLSSGAVCASDDVATQRRQRAIRSW